VAVNDPTPFGGADPRTSLVDLLDDYQRRILLLTAARADDQVARPDQLVGHALAALTTAHAVAEGLFAERWPIVCDALAHGATLDQIGAATGGLEPDELVAGLTAWADRQVAAGQLTPRSRAAVIGLAERRPG
jgi:hypothetical protein